MSARSAHGVSHARLIWTLMISRTAVAQEAGTVGSSTPDLATNRLGFISLLLLSAWCGLVAGLLEVGTIVLRKQVFDPDHLYRMSRHFVWLIPLTNLCVFLALGLLGCGVILVWPRRGRWLVTRGLAAMTALTRRSWSPFRGSTVWPGWSWRWGSPRGSFRSLSADSRGFRRFVLVSFPVAVAVVAILGASLWVGDRIKQARENARPLPPPGSPNVLLIVLDTVAAGHLSLHGYDRATSTTLVELAERGIRFDSARAASSWTLPSHATHVYRTMVARAFGRLVYSAGPNPSHAGGVPRATGATRRRDSSPTRGIAAPIRGWPAASPFTTITSSRSSPHSRRPCWSVEPWKASRRSSISRRIGWSPPGCCPMFERLWRSLYTDRKGAAVVNRELLDWLSHAHAAGAAVFRLLELLSMLIIPINCRREGFTVSGSSRPTIISAS